MDGLTGWPTGVTIATQPISTNTLQQDVNSGGLTLDSYPTSGDTSYGGTSYNGGTTSTAPAIDQATLDAYNQAISQAQKTYDLQGNYLDSGNSTIQASYENALNQLLGAKNQANQAYDTNKLQSGQDYVAGKNTVGANAGSSLNGLLRLLGSRGAGGSSAYNIAAPGAVGRAATLQRSGLANTFGRNNQSLDTAWNNYLTDYTNQVSGAADQRHQQRETLQNQIETNKANLLQTLAQLSAQKAAYTGGDATAASQPFLNQANSLLEQASNYKTSPIAYQTKAYTAPSLDKYTSTPFGAPKFNGQTQTSDYVSPYLAALLGKKQLASA